MRLCLGRDNPQQAVDHSVFVVGVCLGRGHWCVYSDDNRVFYFLPLIFVVVDTVRCPDVSRVLENYL